MAALGTERGIASDEPAPRLVELVDDGRVELFILPTERCNFRCTYCYETFAIGKMQRRYVQAVKAFLNRRAPSLSELLISWFGGEPLLAPDVVCEISAHAQRLASQHGFKFRSAATTNGFFLEPDLRARLVHAGVTQFQISLDGPAEEHDRSRRHANGSGTFDRIWANVKSIHDSNDRVEVLLRIHYDNQSVRSTPRLVERIASELLPDPRFRVMFKAVERLGGSNDAELDVVDPAARKAYEDEFASLLGIAQDDVRFIPSPVCYAARPNSLIFRADGRIAKCTVALEDDRNTIGRLRDDGTLDLDPILLQPWLRGLTNMDPSALACPLAGLPTARQARVERMS